MSAILKRTVLYEKRTETSPFHFIGWALVNTPIGVCAEPFEINNRFVPGNSYANFDYTDEIARIDDMKNVPYGHGWKAVSFGETMPIHGGNISPEVYIRDGNF